MTEPTSNDIDGPKEEPEVTSGPPAITAELGPILEMLPEGEPRQQALLLMTRVVSRAYRGPVPPADEMENFKRVDPSFPERFVTMAEKEQSHRHDLDKADQLNDFALKKSGQDKAFWALIAILAVVLALVFMKEPKVAGILAGTAIVGVVGIFVTGRYLEYKSDQSEGSDD